MATRTFVTTSDQERVLQWIVDQLNVEEKLDPALTIDSYIQQRIPELLYPFVLQFKAAEKAQVATKFALASAADQQAIRDLLRL